MTSRDFCYWLQGFFELGDMGIGKEISVKQARMIQNHLALVFEHEIDPSVDGGDKAVAEELKKVHDGFVQSPSFNPSTTLIRC